MTGPQHLEDIESGAALRHRVVCPRCRGALRSGAGSVNCPQCGENWPVIDGVPHFVQEFPYWGEVPHEQMMEVNRRAETDWRAALLDFPDPVVQRAAEMVLNLDRANWHWLAGVSPDARVLDIGAGMGTNSHALATCYREVAAVEPVLERIRFMRQRFAQENLRNVSIIRSSVWGIPFEDEVFDLVAMNGVLEWVPGGQERDPEQCQLDALRETRRLLRPGGRLYVGIENRYCPGHFVGHPDPHCGLPFVTVLPRPLAHWYARRKGQNGYRNYLYSAPGYARLLRKAGYRKVEIYAALPSYNHPRFFVPMDRRIYAYYTAAFTSPPSGALRRLFHQALLKLNLLQHCGYSFAIFATK